MDNKNKESFSSKNDNKNFLLIFWLFCSVVGFMILIRYDINYAMIIFGQLFFVHGISVIKSMRKLCIHSIMCVLAGGACIIIPIINILGRIFNFTIDWDFLLPLFIMSFFIFIIANELISSIVNSKKENAIHKVKVMAKVTDYEYVVQKDGHIICRPIYNFEFDGVKYQVPSNKYSEKEELPIGTLRTFRVDPDNLNQVIDDTQAKINIIGLIMLLLVPLAILVCILTFI